jgi:16S rRNA (guanine527-N7)-methyltransferase
MLFLVGMEHRHGAFPSVEQSMKSITGMIDQAIDFFALDVDSEGKTRLVTYVGELEKWNARMNLTGLHRSDDIVRDLVSDGLFLHTVLPLEGVVLDLGSGAGILAVPLAILHLSRAVRSIDKSLRKIQFQRHIKRLLGLSNLTVYHGRSEELESVNADILVAKAFGSIADILRLGGPHLVGPASAFLVRGGSEVAPTEEGGFVLTNSRRYQLPKSSKAYQLFEYKKVTQLDVLC